MGPTQLSSAESGQAMQAILARARTDRAFRSRLLDAPKAVFDGAGVALPPGLDLRTLDGASRTAYLVLPPAPAEGEVSDTDLATASGGTTPACVVTVVGTLILSAAVTADLYFNWE